MIAVDSNVVAYLYLPSNYTKHAESLLQRDSEWVAPVLWRSEFRNILAGFMRRKVLLYERARELQHEPASLRSIEDMSMHVRNCIPHLPLVK